MGKRIDIPPDFLAPNRFPGPSLPLLTVACWACEACRLKTVGWPAVRWRERRANVSAMHNADGFDPPPEVRAIEVSAARKGGCNRGSSIVVICVCSQVKENW